MSLDWKVFNSFFESSFKMGKTTYSFFLDSSKVFWNLSMFCGKLVKKTRHFSKHSKTGVQNKNSVFFFRRKVFFQFCKVGVRLLVFEKDFSKKILNCCFSCAEDIGYFFLKKICFFSDFGSKCFGVGQKCFGRSLKSAFKVCTKTFYLVFFLKNYHFSRTPNYFSSQLGKKFLALISKVLSRCAREQLGNFSNWNVFLVMYSERKTSRLWSKILRQESQFFFFFVRTEFFGAFFLRELGFFRTVSLNFGALAEKFSKVVSKVHSICAENRSICFFRENVILFLRFWTIFLAVWV